MQEKIKILFVITQSEMGGAQKFLNTLIRELDQEKYAMRLVSGPGNWEGFDVNIPKTKLETAKRNISPINDVRTIFELRKLVKDFNPEVLFLNSSKTTVWGPLAVMGLKKKPKIIYRIGGWSFNDPRPNWEKKLWIWIEKAFSKYKEYIVVNSKYDLEQARELNIRPKREIKLIYNGVDTNKLHFLTRRDARTKLEINNGEKIVGVIANMYKTKGLEYLIPAAKLTDYKFMIIGDGPERQKIKDMISVNNLNKKIILVGHKSNAYRYMKAFDVFLLPSLKEGFPWVILEAMAAKVPIIATRVGAIPEIMSDNIDGILIEPKKPQQIIEALNAIQNIDTVSRAYDTLIRKFTLSKMTSEIENIIDN